MNLNMLYVYTITFIPVRNPYAPVVQEGNNLISHSWSLALPTLTSAIDGGQWQASRPGRFTLRSESRYPLQRRLVVHPGPFWTIWRKVNPSPSEFETQSV